MNNRILISLSVIGVVAAIAIGGTIAYFSDTETSTGNTFTAGTLDLKVDNECSLNGIKCIQIGFGDDYYWDLNGNGTINDAETAPENECSCTWGLSDLDGKLFFNFSDLKPGDTGEDTISLHVNSNPSWVCLTFKNMADDDNQCTEPEDEDGDVTCGDQAGLGGGELSEELEFAFWADVCEANSTYGNAYPGDNIYQPNCDKAIGTMWQKTAKEIFGKTYALADSGQNVFTETYPTPLVGGATYYIGKMWCFGNLTGNPAVGWICDGETMNLPKDNLTQGDSLKVDVEFTAVQSRNNANFTCIQTPVGYNLPRQYSSAQGNDNWYYYTGTPTSHIQAYFDNQVDPWGTLSRYDWNGGVGLTGSRYLEITGRDLGNWLNIGAGGSSGWLQPGEYGYNDIAVAWRAPKSGTVYINGMLNTAYANATAVGSNDDGVWFSIWKGGAMLAGENRVFRGNNEGNRIDNAILNTSVTVNAGDEIYFYARRGRWQDSDGMYYSFAISYDPQADRTAPVSTYSVNGNYLTLTATDSGTGGGTASGVAKIEYAKYYPTGTDWIEYTVPITFIAGEKYMIRAMDNMGNIEAYNRISI